MHAHGLKSLSQNDMMEIVAYTFSLYFQGLRNIPKMAQGWVLTSTTKHVQEIIFEQPAVRPRIQFFMQNRKRRLRITTVDGLQTCNLLLTPSDIFPQGYTVQPQA